MNRNNQSTNRGGAGTAAALLSLLFGFLGMFFLVLNPAEGVTAAEFVVGMALSKGAMALCWALAVRAYRRYLRAIGD